jgi:hypothetical protein
MGVRRESRTDNEPSFFLNTISTISPAFQFLPANSVLYSYSFNALMPNPCFFVMGRN